MIISVINLKGGSGKTTTAMALATAAARHNRNVSVLDTDPQGDATTWAGDAEDAGETLPFTVDSANIGKLKRLRKPWRMTNSSSSTAAGRQRGGRGL